MQKDLKRRRALYRELLAVNPNRELTSGPWAEAANAAGILSLRGTPWTGSKLSTYIWRTEKNVKNIRRVAAPRPVEAPTRIEPKDIETDAVEIMEMVFASHLSKGDKLRIICAIMGAKR